MGEPLFGGVAFGVAADSALAGDPQIDDLGHVRAPTFAECTIGSFRVFQHSAPIAPIRWQGMLGYLTPPEGKPR